jgi:hypothetical protein
MLLASFYIWSITASFWWQKLIVTVLITSMALALWQKARDAMPYLLDPAAAPPARVALADGLIGATAFFILQGVAVLILADAPNQVDLRATTLGFISAGILVYADAALLLARANGRRTGHTARYSVRKHAESRATGCRAGHRCRPTGPKRDPP